MNGYRTFSFVFHKTFQRWAGWPVCLLDEILTDAEVCSALEQRCSCHLCRTGQGWQALYICNSAQIFPLNKFSFKKTRFFSELIEWQEHRRSSRGETVKCHNSFGGAGVLLRSLFCPVLVWSPAGSQHCWALVLVPAEVLWRSPESEILARAFWKAVVQDTSHGWGSDPSSDSFWAPLLEGRWEQCHGLGRAVAAGCSVLPCPLCTALRWQPWELGAGWAGMEHRGGTVGTGVLLLWKGTKHLWDTDCSGSTPWK